MSRLMPRARCATTLLLGVAPARGFLQPRRPFPRLDSKAAVCGDADPVVHIMPPVPPSVAQPMPEAAAGLDCAARDYACRAPAAWS